MSHSMKFHKDKGYLFLSAPIDIGKFLHEGLLNNSSSVVFTSATLANAEGDKGVKGIEWATGYSYLDPKKRFQKVKNRENCQKMAEKRSFHNFFLFSITYL